VSFDLNQVHPRPNQDLPPNVSALALIVRDSAGQMPGYPADSLSSHSKAVGLGKPTALPTSPICAAWGNTARFGLSADTSTVRPRKT